MLPYCSRMSPPPLPAAPLAARLAWLAGEVRAEKDDAGMIVAAFIEMFARLLGRLAGFVGRIEAGRLQLAQAPVAPVRPAAVLAPSAGPVARGLLPRVFGWLGGMLPIGGRVVLATDLAGPCIEAGRSSSLRSSEKAGEWVGRSEMRAAILPAGGTPPPAPRARKEGKIGEPAGWGHRLIRAALPASGWARGRVPPSRSASSVWGAVAAWLGLPGSVAGPLFQNGDFGGAPLHVYFVALS